MPQLFLKFSVKKLKRLSCDLERRMFDVNRMGFTNQFVNGSRFVEEFDYAASFVETRT